MPADLQKARELFLHAVGKLPMEQWDGYVAEACGGDRELEKQVRHLLHVHREAGSFLESPAAPLLATVDVPPAERPGTNIGLYKLLEQIGEGGMGTVWMAQQTEPIKRLVAVKLIKPGMDSRQVIARFEAERQALAIMDHPNIARVLDGGTIPLRIADCGLRIEESLSPNPQSAIHNPQFGGRPYFVMDLVKGVPITKFCDDHKLTPRQRLELFIPACQAVQHAHQKGIIHRDLKPSNVLVALYDGKPVPKVIDFGVAKAAGQPLTEQTLVTGFGAIVGTLEYMSPEQAEVNQLDIDTRSDIYSLGVLLYELLAGSPPFSRKELEKAGMLEMLRVIREEEPTRPSTKLSTADGLPTLAANRGTEPAKLTKLVRGELDWIVMKALEKDRNRRYETANGFAADVQRYLNDEAVQACPPSVGYRLRKFMRRNKRALAVAGLLLSFIVLLGGGAGWVLRDRSARLATTERESEAALAEATQLASQRRWPEALAWVQRAEGVLVHGAGSAALQRRVQDLRRDLELVAKLEEIRLQKAEVKDGHFDFERPQPEYEEAFREYGIDVTALDAEEAAKRIRARTIPVELASALDDWSSLLRIGGKVNESRHLCAVARLADPDPWRNRVRDAWQQSDRKALEDLAAREQTNRMSPQTFDLLELALRTPAAIEQRLTLLRQAQRRHPADFWTNSKLGICLTDEAKPARPGEAVRFFTAAVALRPRSPGAHFNLGMALSKSGSHDEAVAAFREAIRLKPDYDNAHGSLGISLKAQGKPDEAIAAYREAVRLKPGDANAHTNLGVALTEQQRLDEAIACCRKAIELDPNQAHAHYNLGIALSKQGKLDEAIVWHRKAIELNPKVARIHTGLGFALHKQGKVDEAIACYKKAISLDPKDARAHNNLGHALADQGQLDEAIVWHRKAISLDPKDASAHNNLGWALSKQGQLDEAIACYRKTIELDPKLAYAHFNLGNALADQGKLDEAIASYKKALNLDPKDARAHTNLGNALSKQGKLDEAIACFSKAVDLNPKSAIARRNLGILLRKQGRLDEAIAAYRKALELKSDADAHHSLGLALRDQEKWVEAIAAFEDAIRLKKDSSLAYVALAELLTICRDTKHRDARRAVTAAKKAVELDPQSALAWQSLGWAHYRAGDWQASIQALEKSCGLEKGGDCEQGIVMALAHWKLSNQQDLPAPEQIRRRTEARRYYEQSGNQIDGRGGHPNGFAAQAVRTFREEAVELMGMRKEKK